MLIVCRVLYIRKQISRVERKFLLDGRGVREIGEKIAEKIGEEDKKAREEQLRYRVRRPKQNK